MSGFKKGGMYILSSPSGAGKTTLVKKYQQTKIFQFQYLILLEIQDQMKKMENIIILYQKIILGNLLKKMNF